MALQKYKNVYFSDHPADSPQKKNLTIAFGKKDDSLYEIVKPLSSQGLRELLQHPTFTSIQEAADQDNLSVNTYCLRLLRQKERMIRDALSQPYLPGFSRDVRPIDPIQVTFKGGQSEPLHDWYPYLEGYSPRFVEHVLQEFAPRATCVLDPFAGTGTTPLTVARLGKLSLFSEVNPLLQYLIETKLTALTMAGVARKHIAIYLREHAQVIEKLVADIAPDSELEQTYARSFDNSHFFDEETFQQVLRLRSVIDSIACTTPVVARFIAVAVLSSLVPASLLIRRGDMRYKTEQELERSHVSLLPAVQSQLIRIAADLERLDNIDQRSVLICEDARNLGFIPAMTIDTVVTSPPYLNGTNYFRNTKIELWFLRCLRSDDDLSEFRRKAVTAGINDVTVSKCSDAVSQSVTDVVARLDSAAYDRRIPHMVASYFHDMQAVFKGIRKHLTSDAKVIIDIGDSSYGGIHVPTDALLTDVLAAEGFVLTHDITLRKRMSRNGFPLRQALLVFRLQQKRGRTAKEAPQNSQAHWEMPWADFKNNLPHQQDAYAKRNWGNPLHSLCSYQGKMKPSLASYLVRTFVPSGGTLLDPFAGVGTIPFEAALQGMKTWSFDISPTALHIATAKLGRLDHNACEAVLHALDAFIAMHEVTDAEIIAAQEIRFNQPLTDYFEQRTFREILLARRYFSQNKPSTPSESLVLASLLHILHGNRPYALSRRSHPITPFAPSGEFEYRPLVPRLRDKVNRSLSVTHTDEFLPGHVVHQDATAWWPQGMEQLDAIITSPPFFDSTRFYLSNWMRLWFCGWERPDFRSKPLAFVDERQKLSFDIYQPIFRQARERLKEGGVFVVHLGKSNKCDMAQELSKVAMRWFRVVDIFAENVDHCESHGIRDKGTVGEHTYLVLQ